MNNIYPERKILIVEDNLINQAVLRNYLQMLGLDVDVAENGLIGYQRCFDTKYDLIFMDIHMPVMDGYEATQKIRSSECDNSNTAIVAVTTDDLPEDRDKCLANGMNEYLSKPINFELLKIVLNTFLSISA